MSVVRINALTISIVSTANFNELSWHLIYFNRKAVNDNSQNGIRLSFEPAYEILSSAAGCETSRIKNRSSLSSSLDLIFTFNTPLIEITTCEQALYHKLKLFPFSKLSSRLGMVRIKLPENVNIYSSGKLESRGQNLMSYVKNQCLLSRYRKVRQGSDEMKPREISEANNLQCLMLILPIRSESGVDDSNKQY